MDVTDQLSILTTTLPPGATGGKYTFQLYATGGLPPYRWSITSTDAEFLSIDDRGLLSSTALGASGDYEVEIQVLDSSDHGQGKSASKNFALEVAGCIEDVGCFVEVRGACYQGFRSCVDGELRPCASTNLLSQDIDHCGARCDACPQGRPEHPELRRADNCLDGLCMCGEAPMCDAGETCCIGENTTCADLRSTEHCNACFHDCSTEVEHVQRVLCNTGQCDYNICESGWLDCDGDRSNGCETAQDAEHCADCTDACESYEHVVSAECVAGQCAFVCEPGWAHCRGYGDIGCDTDITQTNNCGGCGRNCPAHATNKVCIHQGGNYYCGCDPHDNAGTGTNPDANQGCADDEICCGTLCVAHNEAHCASCDNACAISNRGPWCDCVRDIDENCVPDEWACTCSDGYYLVDAACRTYSFSEDQCSDGICYCENGPACEAPYACCDISGGHDMCFNLAPDISEGRTDHCGICGVSCPDSGAVCDAGACTCPEGTCPEHSNATDCIWSGKCGCGYYGGPPCPVGQYCVVNKGCCPEKGSDSGDCSIKCYNREGGRQWCDSAQCCTDCNDETTCDCADYGYHIVNDSPVAGYMPCPADKFCCEDEGCCDRPCHIPDKACCLKPNVWCPDGTCKPEEDC